jgi:hypothetical protein
MASRTEQRSARSRYALYDSESDEEELLDLQRRKRTIVVNVTEIEIDDVWIPQLSIACFPTVQDIVSYEPSLRTAEKLALLDRSAFTLKELVDEVNEILTREGTFGDHGHHIWQQMDLDDTDDFVELKGFKQRDLQEIVREGEKITTEDEERTYSDDAV